MRRSEEQAKGRRRWLLLLPLLALLAADVQSGSALGPAASYSTVVFADGFESGTLAAWDGALGTGTVSVTADAARTGDAGLRQENASGQFSLVVKTFPSALVDSSTTLRVRVGSEPGLRLLAQARDGTSTAHMWNLLYDGQRRGLLLYVFRGTQATEIFTGANTVTPGAWTEIEVQYTATADGGGQIAVDGSTTAAWRVTGDYTRASNYQKLQVWNDAAGTVDVDDVTVAAPPPPGAAAPGPPTAVAGTPGDGSVALTWAAPASDGGSAITAYRITPYVGTTAQTPTTTGSAATSATISGLANGTAYTFRVAAINDIGTGPDSAASAAVTPGPPPEPTVPGAPTAVQATPGDGSATVTWTPPASDGGSPITGYRVTPYVGATAQTPVVTSTSATTTTITGLANGTGYSFRVAAINAAGTGADSAGSAPVTPGAASAAYPATVFADGFESGTLAAWDGSLGTGAAAVSAQAARSGEHGLRQTNASGQISLVVKTFAAALPDSSTTLWVRVGSETGLRMLAQARDGASSAHMWDLVYDGQRRGLLLFAFRGSQSAQIFTGTSSVTPGAWTRVEVQYTATANGGAQLYLNGTTDPAWRLSGDYTRPTHYQKLQVWNDAAGTVDVDDVRVATPPPAGAAAPGAPTAVSGTPADGAVAVSWTAPADDGGSAITGYRITPYAGTTALPPTVTSTPATSVTVAGLDNGTAYTFRVAAVNGAGTGPDSAPSPPVTPAAAQPPSPPGPPTGVGATPGNGSAKVSWTAPADDGGSAITGYRVTPYAGTTALPPTVTSAPATSVTVAGLDNGTAYTFRVAAVNGAGTGPDSAPSPPVTPSAPPPATTIVSLTFDDGNGTQWALRDTLREHGMKATFYVNSGLTPDVPGWRLSWGQLAALEDDGHEIAGHALTHADLAQMSPADQAREVCDDRADLLARGFSPVSSFAYPYGAFEQNDVPSTVRDCGYASGRRVGGLRSSTCPQCAFAETVPPADPMVVRTPPDVRVDMTLAEMQGYVTQAEEHGGGWVPMVFHYICDACDEYSVSMANLEAFLDWLEPRAAQGTVVRTVGEVIGAAPQAMPPGAPSGVAGTPGDGSVALEWEPPASDGGSPVTGYRITAYAGGGVAATLDIAAETSATVDGLTNGTAYTFTVAARNGAGLGPPSAASAPVVPTAGPAPEITPPGAPSDVAAVAGAGSAHLTWSAPEDDGGSAVTGYVITPSRDGTPLPSIATPAATSATVSGLTNGASYTFTVAATNAAGTGEASAPSAAVTPAPLEAPEPMPVISRNVPAHTNDSCGGGYPPGRANDAAYPTYWRTCEGPPSETAPKWLAYDLSGVPASARGPAVVAWFNEPMTGAFDHVLTGGVAYNNVGAYTIQINPGPGGGPPPSTGWTTVVTVSGNTYSSRQHPIDLAGANWLRMVITASDGSPGNDDVALNLDVHSAPDGPGDDWLFLGDSITQDGMLHDTRTSASGATVGTFSQLVAAARPEYFPLFQSGGSGGIDTAGAAAAIDTWLPLFPGRYVALALGSNDALAAPGDPRIAARFRTNMAAMIEAVLAAGKVPVVPTIPWGRDAKLAANVPVLNAEIDTLLAEYPQAVRGPDLYALYEGDQSLISADGIHPTLDAGYAALRQAWAAWAVATVYP